jgi:septal ring factor EnvC (AmiA/AmiB activator)
MMDSEAIFIEVNTQLGNIAKRLDTIEEKIDMQNERDHQHELKLQELENKINSLTEKTSETLASMQANNGGFKRDIDNLAEKIRQLENHPVEVKAALVNRIMMDKALEIIIAASVGGAVVWLIGKFK